MIFDSPLREPFVLADVPSLYHNNNDNNSNIVIVNRSQVERVGCKSLSYAARVLQMNHVFKLIRNISPSRENRVSASHLFLEDLIDRSIDRPDLQSQISSKFPSFQSRSCFLISFLYS